MHHDYEIKEEADTTKAPIKEKAAAKTTEKEGKGKELNT